MESWGSFLLKRSKIENRCHTTQRHPHTKRLDLHHWGADRSLYLLQGQTGVIQGQAHLEEKSKVLGIQSSRLDSDKSIMTEVHYVQMRSFTWGKFISQDFKTSKVL